MVEQALAKKALDEFRDSPPCSPSETCRMVWMIYRNREENITRQRIIDVINDSPEMAVHFLAVGATYSDTTGQPERCWIWQGEKSIRELNQIIDLDLLKTTLPSVLKPPTPQDTPRPVGGEEFETLHDIGWKVLEYLKKQEATS